MGACCSPASDGEEMTHPATQLVFLSDRGDDGRRLDQVVLGKLGPLRSPSRTSLQQWVVAGLVQINGETVHRSSQRLRKGDTVVVALPPPAEPFAPRPVEPEAMAFDVLYEDDSLLVLNKPPGVLVHPTSRERAGTLLNGLRGRAAEHDGGERYYGLVHRLDRETSGVLLVAKSRAAHAALGRSFERLLLQKEYLACVRGIPKRPWGRIALRIGRDPDDRRRMRASPDVGRESVTLWQLVATAPAERLSLVRCRPLTGRTHQIRVHLAAIGLPLLGDRFYGDDRALSLSGQGAEAGFGRHALHASAITIRDGDRGHTIRAPLAADFARWLTTVRFDGALVTPGGAASSAVQEGLDRKC
jgi:23S rRNA pseudouridine1911/1915/1917 synthase